MMGIRILMTIGLSILAVAAFYESEARAGSYTIKQCEGAQYVEFQAPYMSVNGGRNVDVVRGCDIANIGKVGIYQDRSGPSMSYGNGGQFLWEAPVGVSITATEFTSRLKNANGIKAQLLGWDGSNFTYLDGGFTHDGIERRSSWNSTVNPQPMIVVRLICQETSGCENRNTSAKAFLEVTDVEFTAQDTISPQIGGSGELWEWADGKFHRGWASIRVDASDQGSGIASTWLEVNGLRVETAPSFCPGVRGSHSTRLTPCPTFHGSDLSLDTAKAPFRDGSNSIRACAADYADSAALANRSCTQTRTVWVDNQPPDRPRTLRVEEGEGWNATDGFHLSWETPEGQIAPVDGAWYVITGLEDGSFVESVNVKGDSLEALGPLSLPEPGAYLVRVYLTDAAGNMGQPSEAVLRFDNRPPGNVNPEPATGWISRDELPLAQRIEEAQPGGPSGIGGYAMKTSPAGPVDPCETAICLAPEITLAGGAEHRTGSIGGLGEGNHWVSVAAVSGAGRRSTEPGSTLVQVDRTPPTTTIGGVAGGWSNRPVTVTVMATDDLSGMEPVSGDEGRPQTVIQVGNQSPYEAEGPAASFTIATEGSNRIKYWAEDLAGNRNDGLEGQDGERHVSPGQAIVNIDMTPPSVTFDPVRDSSDPEIVRVVAHDLDSGVESASISMRRAGSPGGYDPLPTLREGGSFWARIPSDDMQAGSYELRATARDRAGNEGQGNADSAQRSMLVELPLKEVTSLTAAMKGGRKVVRTGYAKRQFVEGRLTVEGQPVPNQRIELVEEFAPGAREESRVLSTETDGDGRYRFGLGQGPTRTVLVTYPGTRTLTRTAARVLRLDVKGRVRYRIKPGKLFNGGAVTMKGRVGFRGAIPPSRGKLVAIQYLDPSRRKWRPVEVLRTNRKGAFRYKYRFRTISSAQKIIFRALALPEAGWPYLPSTSRPRSVIVYPKGRTRR